MQEEELHDLNRNLKKLGVDCKYVDHFNMNHLGWEADEDGWLVRDPEGKLRAITTNHGSPQFTDVEDLQIHKDELMKQVTKLEDVIFMMRRENLEFEYLNLTKNI